MSVGSKQRAPERLEPGRYRPLDSTLVLSAAELQDLQIAVIAVFGQQSFFYNVIVLNYLPRSSESRLCCVRAQLTVTVFPAGHVLCRDDGRRCRLLCPSVGQTGV